MKTLVFSIALALWSMGAATARAADFKSGVVRVSSSERFSSVKWNGSGLLFREQGRVYALTSDHVLIHGNSGVLQTVFHERFGTLKANFLVADWAYGLALLEIEGVPAEERLPDLEALSQVVEVRTGDRVTVAGYPYGADAPVIDPVGEVIAPRAKLGYKLFYSVDGLIEIVGAHGEFGMSGGAMLDAGGRFVGVLSHQILKDPPEGALLINPKGISGAAMPKVNHLLAIPGATAAAWARRVVDGGTKEVHLFEPASSQLGRQDILFSGRLSLYPISESRMILGRANPNPSGISPDPNGAYATWEKIVQDSHDASPEVIGFRPKTKDCFKAGCWGRVVGFKSMTGFLDRMDDPALEPVALRSMDSAWEMRQLDQVSQELDAAYRSIGFDDAYGKLRQFSDIFQDLARATADPERTNMSTGAWRGIKPNDIDELIQSPTYAETWSYLGGKNPSSVKALQDAIRHLQELLRKFTI